MSRFSRWILGDSFIVLTVPFMFLLLVVLPIEFSNAQEDEATIEVCRPASTVIIATDGGVVDLSALDESEVARVSGAKGSTENVINELKEECGFASFVLVDGDGSSGSNGASALSLRSSDKYTDPLSYALLEACNYSVAIVEVQKEDVCEELSVPVCADDQKASPWLEDDDRGYLWSGDRGYLWSGVRSNPWFDSKASPWLEINGELCVDDKGYLWSGDRGYLWSGDRGYLWSGDRGYLWSGDRGYLWSGVRGYLWSGVRASPWLENRSNPWFD